MEKKIMKYEEELKSKRSPLIKKAAKAIRKEKLSGYGDLLYQALISEYERGKSWESQHEIVLTMAATDCVEYITELKELLGKDQEFPVMKRTLSFAIAYLENKDTKQFDFIYQSLGSDDKLIASGVCAAIYMRKLILTHQEFEKVMEYIKKPIYNQEIMQIVSPFVYILAASYLWEEKYKDEIIAFSSQFDDKVIRGIICDVRNNKDCKRGYF